MSLWYKDAVIYQVHVRTFADSDGDGIGDFPGLTARLDYLQELGVTAVWLLPFYPSPLRDEGYDIADYRGVNPLYGDLGDFERFLGEAHRRGLEVITELVINHTSDQHPWFQAARRAAPGSPERELYVWSDTGTEYADARIIFKDFETSNWTWDPVAGAYYWHRFYHHQPDLNFASPRVREEVEGALDFWFELGVDGMRLDAVPYLCEREGTNCENLPETHQILKALRAHVDQRHPGKMLLAEANQWPEDAVEYFGAGDECHMAFHFPVMPRLFMAVRMEDRFPIIDILEQTPEIPPGCQWATFLRNHDELTLEMVTDEDRDYMYRVYAADPRARINLGIRRRLAPLLGNDRRRIELMAGLLMALPGTPIVYYGDEIGMGDNFYLGDRNGVRTPMQWSPDRNAGFSRANPQKLYLPVVIDPEYHYEAVNVETQDGNPSSLLWWHRRLIALRKRFRAFGRGTIEFLQPENHRVLAFLRAHEDERILVVANLSRFVQHVELDLSAFAGVEPLELFGRTPFPRIGELPYLLTLGGHGFYWFSLTAADAAPGEGEVPTLMVAGGWEACFSGPGRRAFAELLPRMLAGQPWFAGGSRAVTDVDFETVVPVAGGAEVTAGAGAAGGTSVAGGAGAPDARLVVATIAYLEEEAESYTLSLAFAPGAEGERRLRERPGTALAWLDAAGEGESGLVFDALDDAGFCRALVAAIDTERTLPADRAASEASALAARRTTAFEEVVGPGHAELPVRFASAERASAAVVLGERATLELVRKLDPGASPAWEIGRFLTESVAFPHTPAVAGALELTRRGSEPWTVAILAAHVAAEGEAWRQALDYLGRFFERVVTHPEAASAEVTGAYPAQARLLGRRTAELHRALAARPADPEFRPEPFSELYQRSLYQSLRTAAGTTLRLLARRRDRLPDAAAREAAERLLASRDALLARFQPLVGDKIDALRIRCHGSYHLGKVLTTGKDFVIGGFAGEPTRALSARRIKRSPLTDVAGMLRSFDYAVAAGLGEILERGGAPAERMGDLERWGRRWYHATAAAFLGKYLEAADTALLPSRPADLRLLLGAYVLDRALVELAAELDRRPGWAGVPLAAILRLLDGEPVEGVPETGGEAR